jgi:hypothetical protein
MLIVSFNTLARALNLPGGSVVKRVKTFEDYAEVFVGVVVEGPGFPRTYPSGAMPVMEVAPKEDREPGWFVKGMVPDGRADH